MSPADDGAAAAGAAAGAVAAAAGGGLDGFEQADAMTTAIAAIPQREPLGSIRSIVLGHERASRQPAASREQLELQRWRSGR